MRFSAATSPSIMRVLGGGSSEVPCSASGMVSRRARVAMMAVNMQPVAASASQDMSCTLCNGGKKGGK